MLAGVGLSRNVLHPNHRRWRVSYIVESGTGAIPWFIWPPSALDRTESEAFGRNDPKEFCPLSLKLID